MTELAGNWVKHGSKKLWKTHFATKIGAQRAANTMAKKRGKGYEASTPSWSGSYWTCYVIKLKTK